MRAVALLVLVGLVVCSAVASPEDPTIADVIPWIRGNRTEIEAEITAVSDRVTTLANTVQPLPSAVENLSTNVQSLNGQVSLINSQVTDQLAWSISNHTQLETAILIESGRITTIADTLQPLPSQVQTLNSSVNAQAAALTTLNSQVADQLAWSIANHTQLETAILIESGRIATLADTVQPLPTQVETLNNSLIAQTGAVNTLGTHVGALSGQVADQLAWSIANRTELQSSITNLDGRVTTLTTKVDPLPSAVENISRELDSLTGRFSVLSTTVDTAASNITILQNNVIGVNQRIDAIAGFNSTTIVTEVVSLRDWVTSANTTIKQQGLQLGYLEQEAVDLKQRVDANHAEIQEDVKVFNEKIGSLNQTSMQLQQNTDAALTAASEAKQKAATLELTVAELNKTNAELRQATAALLSQLNDLRASIKQQCLKAAQASADRRLLGSSNSDPDDICTPAPPKDELSGGMIALITIGGLAGAGAVLGSVVCYIRRKKRKMSPLLGEDELHAFEPSTRDKY